jgi:hypothetical protein
MHSHKKAKKVQTSIKTLTASFDTITRQIQAAHAARNYGLALTLSNQALETIKTIQRRYNLDCRINIAEVLLGKSDYLAKLGHHTKALAGFSKVISLIEVNPRNYTHILPRLEVILENEKNDIGERQAQAFLSLPTIAVTGVQTNSALLVQQAQLSQYFTDYGKCLNQVRFLTLMSQLPLLVISNTQPTLQANAASTTSSPATSTTTFRIDVLTDVAERMLKVHPTQKGPGHSK